jgi:hypothetical protein
MVDRTQPKKIFTLSRPIACVYDLTRTVYHELHTIGNGPPLVNQRSLLRPEVNLQSQAVRVLNDGASRRAIIRLFKLIGCGRLLCIPARRRSSWLARS